MSELQPRATDSKSTEGRRRENSNCLNFNRRRLPKLFIENPCSPTVSNSLCRSPARKRHQTNSPGATSGLTTLKPETLCVCGLPAPSIPLGRGRRRAEEFCTHNRVPGGVLFFGACTLVSSESRFLWSQGYAFLGPHIRCHCGRASGGVVCT